MYNYTSLAKKIEYSTGLFNGYVHVYINIFGDLVPFETIEYDDLEEAIKKYKGYYDVFVTENTIDNIYTKENKDVLQFRAFYVDLDKVDNIEDCINKINELVDADVIPVPSKIIFTGRGLHVKWYIKDYAATVKKNITTWNRVETYLVNSLRELGADKKVKDPARVLRIPGTINSKNDEVVRVVLDNELPLYDLYELYNKYTPYKPQQAPKNKKGKKILLTSKNTLNYARLKDLETLLELREYDLSGIRNGFLMFYTTYYILVNNSDYEETLQEIKKISSRIKSKKCTSLSELKSFVRNGLKKIEEHNKGYKVLPNNETIIEWLEISEDEQNQLLTLRGKELKYEKNNLRRKSNRRNEAGLTNKQQELLELKKKAESLRNKGLSNRAIAKEFGCSEGKIRTLFK